MTAIGNKINLKVLRWQKKITKWENLQSDWRKWKKKCNWKCIKNLIQSFEKKLNFHSLKNLNLVIFFISKTYQYSHDKKSIFSIINWLTTQHIFPPSSHHQLLTTNSIFNHSIERTWHCSSRWNYSYCWQSPLSFFRSSLVLRMKTKNMRRKSMKMNLLMEDFLHLPCN